MPPNRITTVETRLLSACILGIPMLYVRPSSWCFELKVCAHEVECVPEALEQGRLFCPDSYRD